MSKPRCSACQTPTSVRYMIADFIAVKMQSRSLFTSIKSFPVTICSLYLFVLYIQDGWQINLNIFLQTTVFSRCLPSYFNLKKCVRIRDRGVTIQSRQIIHRCGKKWAPINIRTQKALTVSRRENVFVCHIQNVMSLCLFHLNPSPGYS